MTQYHDLQYLNLLQKVQNEGVLKQNRTGTATYSLFSQQMRFDLSDGTIPLLTSKKMFTKAIIHELLWYIRGCDGGNIKQLQADGVRIWNEWADEDGNLGPVYGVLWRHWQRLTQVDSEIDWQTDPPSVLLHSKFEESDQLARLIYLLRNNPDDRRMLVTAWDPTLVPRDDKTFAENVANGKQALPPCHYTFQCYVANGRLSLMLNQRSCDLFLGVPFNIAQYSILLHMLAQIANLQPGEFIWNGGDVHIYHNHLDQVAEQLTRRPFASPFLDLNQDVTEIDDFKFEDFQILDYVSHGTIKAQVSV